MKRFGMVAAITVALAGCAMGSPPPPSPAIAVQPALVEQRTPVTILVSIDGFRPDYLDRGVTPTLSRLAAGGVSAAMRPSFPSKTFPNHYTLVTGLRPDRNGIVGNKMRDAARPGVLFTMANSQDGYFWEQAEPIWVTADKAGVRSATMFWPGADVAIAGQRPADWQRYDEHVTSRQRVDAVLDWLRRPAANRPRFMTLYFDTVDTAGHHHGPSSGETTAAVADVDREIGYLVDGLAALGQPANLVIVADHGMAATSPDRVVTLGSLADPADYEVVEEGTYASLDPVPGHEAALAASLRRPHDHVSCWPKAAIPARFHYGRNPRVPAFLCLADVGWLVLDKMPAPDKFDLGNHGYDNDAPDMRALFIANGPAFAAGKRLASFDNVDVAPLLRDLLGLPAGQGLDGSDAPFRGVLKR